MERLRKPNIYGVCDEGDLELGKYPVTLMTVANFLKRIVSKLITYENAFPPRKRELILQRQVKYVEDIIFTRDMTNIGMERKGVIQVISDTGQKNYCVQADIQLDYLIWEKWLPNMKRHGRVVQAQEKTTERSQICVSQQ